MDPQLRRTLTETAYYAVATGLSDAGDPTWGSPVAFLCRSEFDVQLHGPMFIPRHGEEQESFTRLFSEVETPVGALIWPPGNDQTDVTEGFRAHRREVCRSYTGAISHYEVYI